MTLDEYERAGKKIYEDLAKFVATSLTEALAGRGEIRLQHVQHRPKDLKSLREA